jgi:SNW domain-containing protein 1
MTLEDYGDGGAYPEIHVLQYPLNMGRPGNKTQALIPVQVNDKGTIKTDMLVKQGSNKNRIVQTSLADMKEKELTKDDVALPTEDEEAATAERTRQALQSIVEGKIKSAKPTTVNSNTDVEPQYIRYTPNPNAPGYISLDYIHLNCCLYFLL